MGRAWLCQRGDECVDGGHAPFFSGIDFVPGAVRSGYSSPVLFRISRSNSGPGSRLRRNRPIFASRPTT